MIWPLAFIVPEGLNVTLLTPLANQNAPRVPPEVVNDKLLVPESLPIPVTVTTGAKENDITPERSSSPAVVAESEKVIVDVPDKKLKPETVLDVVKAIEEAPTRNVLPTIVLELVKLGELIPWSRVNPRLVPELVKVILVEPTKGSLICGPKYLAPK